MGLLNGQPSKRRLRRTKRAKDESSHDEVFELFGEADPEETADQDSDAEAQNSDQDAAPVESRPRWGGFNRRERIAMIAAGVVCAGCVASAVHAVSTDSTTVADEQAQPQLQEAQSAEADARQGLADQYQDTLSQLPGHESERAAADVATGQDLIDSVTASLGSTNGTKSSAQLLATSYSGLGSDSQLLTDFLPDLVSATATTPQLGADPMRYRVADLQILPAEDLGSTAQDDSSAEQADATTGPHELLLSAQLDPVPDGSAEQDSEASPQIVLIHYTTDRDGHLTDASGQLASETTAQRLTADEDRAAASDENDSQD